MSDKTDMAKFGASQAACYAYPGKDDAKLREAFGEGSSWACDRISDLEAVNSRLVWILKRARKIAWPLLDKHSGNPRLTFDEWIAICDEVDWALTQQAPGHTDLMVTPESIDAYLDKQDED